MQKKEEEKKKAKKKREIALARASLTFSDSSNYSASEKEVGLKKNWMMVVASMEYFPVGIWGQVF
jgi:hypothetical protein